MLENYLLENMVQEQIIARGIKDQKIIEVLRLVDRKYFVPKEMEKLAYEDHPLPIGYGQTISQPYIVAFMTEAAKLTSNDKVLEIGTGSGYQAAILAKLAKEVFSIEIVEPLAKKAESTLKKLGYKNVHVSVGDGYKGWPENAPFDVIILTAAPKFIPETLIKQLKKDGRIIMPVGSFYNQQLIRVTYKNGKLKKEKLTDVTFVPMVQGSE